MMYRLTIVFLFLMFCPVAVTGQNKIKIELFFDADQVDLNKYDHELKLFINDTLFSAYSNSSFFEVPDSINYMKKVKIELSTSKFIVSADIRHLNPLADPFDSLSPTLSFYYTSTVSKYKRKMISELGYIGKEAPFPRFDVVIKTLNAQKPFINRINCYSYSFDLEKQKKWETKGFKNFADSEGGIYLVKLNDTLNVKSILLKPNYDIWSKNGCFRIEGLILVLFSNSYKSLGIIVWQDPDNGQRHSGYAFTEFNDIDPDNIHIKVSSENGELFIEKDIKINWNTLNLAEYHAVEVDFTKPKFINYK